MKKVCNHLIEEITSKQGYTALFKAFVVITTVYLVSIIQVTNIILPIEADAYKLKFTVEKELKKSIEFDSLVCKIETKSYADCKLAKYKYELSNSSIGALDVFQELLYLLAYVTGLLSVVGFICYPYTTKSTKSEEAGNNSEDAKHEEVENNPEDAKSNNI
ncbi:hypothetical protein [Pseudoalteromonas sp. EB27]|uniref:hypothetical protein n=1 Tax=Pseudoalteromonas sp. EB27 TaxID=1938368 RepID=UPI00117A32C6|nr:hypothetical protein [Pseudoalteromonas sp. EB27]